jgi:hypothetical protein
MATPHHTLLMSPVIFRNSASEQVILYQKCYLKISRSVICRLFVKLSVSRESLPILLKLLTHTKGWRIHIFTYIPFVLLKILMKISTTLNYLCGLFLRTCLAFIPNKTIHHLRDYFQNVLIE